MDAMKEKYVQYALVREMLQTADVIREFDPMLTVDAARAIKEKGRLLLTGEGSSRIFPAKNMIRNAMSMGCDVPIVTDGSRQASGYDLKDFAVFAASNSGRTKEVVELLKKLKSVGNDALFGLTAKAENLLSEYCTETFVLSCGWEEAVAATKSVVEQALVYQSVLCHLMDGCNCGREGLKAAGDAVQTALTMAIPEEITQKAANAGTIYFAGYNDGVAEELTLKTNEITRKKSDFLEGTYAVHGIEEVMDANDIVFVVEPMAAEMGKFREVLVDGVGLTVVPIATAPIDGFEHTLVVPEVCGLQSYVFLAAGWNILVEIGLALDVNLDKAERARKVGNEAIG